MNEKLIKSLRQLCSSPTRQTIEVSRAYLQSNGFLRSPLSANDVCRVTFDSGFAVAREGRGGAALLFARLYQREMKVMNRMAGWVSKFDSTRVVFLA